MTSLKKSAVLAAVVALGALAASAQSASAYVVCNNAGECWHTDHRYRSPGPPLQWRRDDWYFHHNWDHDHWRGAPEGRGYYRNGVWITF